MHLSADFRVINVEETSYQGVVRLKMESQSGFFLVLEYPKDAVGVNIKQGNNIRISISNDRDPNYVTNWDVYMSGVVYYVSEGLVKISIGGLILDINNFKDEARIGEKVYIGLKLIR
ncbi:MAG: hypothetical protein TU36_007240 [Vulcanisaeta sp. AZ3]|jgi:hypothetical protein|nr:MAG: hypothetical protein TU36_05540 [Vulcanisaeta sp. AZ3]